MTPLRTPQVCERGRENYLAQVAEMGKLPPEAALIGDLRALSAERSKRDLRSEEGESHVL